MIFDGESMATHTESYANQSSLITNWDEVFSNGLCSFSHWHTKRGHLIFGLKSYVTSILYLRRKNLPNCYSIFTKVYVFTLVGRNFLLVLTFSALKSTSKVLWIWPCQFNVPLLSESLITIYPLRIWLIFWEDILHAVIDSSMDF